MKKFKYVILILILLNIGNYEAKAQCQNCVSPWVCHQFTVDVGNCQDVLYTVCVKCDPTQNRAIFNIIQIENICDDPNITPDDIWDAGNQYILDNIETYCGNEPCIGTYGTPSKVKITHFICGDKFWDGYKETWSDNQSCAKRCVVEYEWCWCDCDFNNCWDERCQDGEVPHKYISDPLTYYVEGTYECYDIQMLHPEGEEFWLDCVLISDCP